MSGDSGIPSNRSDCPSFSFQLAVLTLFRVKMFADDIVNMTHSLIRVIAVAILCGCTSTSERDHQAMDLRRSSVHPALIVGSRASSNGAGIGITKDYRVATILICSPQRER